MKYINKIIMFILFISSATLHASPGSFFATSSGTGTACSQSDPCSLSTALSGAGDAETVYMGAGMYTSLASEVVSIENSISLLGGWDGTNSTPIVRNPALHVSVINGDNTRGGIVVADDLNVTIKGISITNAYAERPGAGLVADGSTSLTLDELSFINSYAHTDIEDYMYGGAVYVRGGTLSIENCSFINNEARGKKNDYGGALAIIEANASILDSSFQENKSWNDSALFFHGLSSSNLNTIHLRNNVFHENGIEFESCAYNVLSLKYADAEIDNNRFTNNIAFQGELINADMGKLKFTNNIISNNTSGRTAGLYIFKNSMLVLSNNIITENNSAEAESAPVAIYYSQGLLAHNTIANNNTDYGVYLGFTLDDANNIGLVNNIITGHSVGIYVDSGAEINAESTLWGDTTQTDGTGTITTVHNYTGNPDFKDDYHIGSNSAAKDRAAITLINLDIDGDSRPQGDGYDIGADEFVNNFTSPALIMYLLN